MEHFPSKFYYNVRDLNKKFKNEKIKLSIFHLNIGSISAHFDELQYFLNEAKIAFDIICSTENKIKIGTDNVIANINLPEYTIESQGKPELAKGGVLFYIKNTIKFKIRSDLKNVQVKAT